MFTVKKGRRFVQACAVLFFCLVFASAVSSEEVLVPQSTADYGSGYTVGGGVLYPGGIPGMGLWLGQPNTLGRNDRALVRFSILPYILSGNPINSAKLSFGVQALAFQTSEDTHEIEITHLPYDIKSLSVNDMLNSRVETVGIVLIKKNEFTNKEYSVDVTKYVNADIEKGNIYSAFRFKDVTAETKSRGTATSIYGTCLKSLLQLKVR